MRNPQIGDGIEPLEARIAPATFVVSNTLDSGPGSLRQAILDANALTGEDSVTFGLPAGSVIALISHLPPITDEISINGFVGTNRISIDGSRATGASGENNDSGLMLLGPGSSSSWIRGLAIYGFDGAGIEVVNSSGNSIGSNYLGLTAVGQVFAKGMTEGVLVSGGTANVIGNSNTGGNFIGGNSFGIRITGSASKTVIDDNEIGRGPTLTAQPNEIGILVENASGTSIGVELGNSIVANHSFGIKLSSGASGTVIQRNLIGSFSASDGKYIGSQEWGIFIDGAKSTTIGSLSVRAIGNSDLPYYGNCISGNSAGGIWIRTGTDGIQILNNRIGTQTTGESLPSTTKSYGIGNGGPGILITRSNDGSPQEGSPKVNVSGNLISGNAGAAIELRGSGLSIFAEITGNLIGANAVGTVPLPNGSGIVVDRTDNVKIGGTANLANTIVSSEGDGILVKNSTNVTIGGNNIGYSSQSPTNSLFGNAGHGIDLVGIGKVDIGSVTSSNIGNVIAFNRGDGIFLDGDASYSGRFQLITLSIYGNFIGTDGSSAKGNRGAGIHIADVNSSSLILIGNDLSTPNSTRTAGGNVVSANFGDGILVERSDGLLIRGNYVGTNVDGTSALGNRGDGIALIDSSFTRITGGKSSGVISGNLGDGISIRGVSKSATGNEIETQIIGGDAKGLEAIGNGGNGISLDGNAVNNSIGRPSIPGNSNCIVGNGGDGIFLGYDASHNKVTGNFIGFVMVGRDLVPRLIKGNDGAGIHLLGHENIIGDVASSDGNIIIGSGKSGIQIGSAESIAPYTQSNGNAVTGNRIGFISLQLPAYPNLGPGINIEHSSDTTILLNEISGHSAQIHLDHAYASLNANYLGVTRDGKLAPTENPSGNRGSYGILAEWSDIRIAGSATSIIAGQSMAGIEIRDGDGGLISDMIIGEVGDFGTANGRGIILRNTQDVTIQDNSIAGNYYAEIQLVNAYRNTVLANTLGTEGDLDAGWYGVEILNGKENQIGGTEEGTSNRIQGHRYAEVTVSGANSFGNEILGNQITLAPKKQGDSFQLGAVVITQAVGTLISQNQIEAVNHLGIVIGHAYGNRVENNFISAGTSAILLSDNTTNTNVAGNQLFALESGVYISASSNGNRIVANDLTAGTGVTITSGIQNLISENKFGVPGDGLFIDLGADGFTPNDPLDADSGSNNLQNSPLLVSAALSGGQTLLRGEYRGAAQSDVRIEWYVNGEFLAETSVRTDENGVVKLALDLDHALEAGAKVSASAIIDFSETSEFSAAVDVKAPAEVIAKGAAAGQKPRVQLRDAVTGEVLVDQLAFGKGFRGGIRVATADVDGDGITDLIATARTGSGSVKIFSGLDGHLISQFQAGPAQDPTIRSIAAGDLDGDGTIEVVVGRALTMGGRILVHDALTGALESRHTPFGFNTPDSLNVSLSDTDGDALPEIVIRAEILGGMKRVVLDPVSGQIERLARLVRN